MFQLHDIRKSKVWQEAHNSGIEIGVEQGIEKTRNDLVHSWLEMGKSAQEIADLLQIPLKEVRRIAKSKKTGG